ncbi:MAG: TIGR03663 family protein [Verrucomicrobiales bacterium]|nr:TIGR03663 family protein [Verrucomicrobiales bacterium]
MKKPDILHPPAILLLLVLALGLGTFYRWISLGDRPMHTDEAILATKTAELWTTGSFDYDPTDYHGPAFHQIAWVYGHLAGWGDPDQWTEAGLRRLCVWCGLALLGLTLTLHGALGTRATLLATLFVAVSPMMVYYSRYYIMEMLLVVEITVALAALWRWSGTRHPGWLMLCGACLGLAHATKETFLINVIAGVIAWLLASLLVQTGPARGGLRLSSSSRRSRLPTWLWILLPAAIVSVTLYSQFFRDWPSVKDSYTTYTAYFHRAGGSGHEKPWHYYLSLIFWRKDGVIWTEALLGGLGIIGILHAFTGEFRDARRQRFLVFLALYTLALFTGYSLLSYKTPWSILSAQYSLTLLAGVGAAALWTSFTHRFSRLLFKIALGLAIYHLCGQTMNAIDRFKSDPRNPYVYSHTSANLLNLVRTVRELQALHPDAALRVQVINADHGWPLPWYFRQLPQVGFQTDVPTSIDADVIISDVAQNTAVAAALRPGVAYKDTGFHVLRPGLPIHMRVRQDLWDALMTQRASTATSPAPPATDG